MTTTLGVIVPCRNEAAVIARKLANLARCAWPTAERAQRVVVVDDGSQDGTAERARAAWAACAPEHVRLEVVANEDQPGKSGAIAAAVRRLGDEVDLIVLTDADVVLAPAALTALAEAFEREPELAMASGAQCFVTSVAADGSLRTADGGALERCNSYYDWFATRVRAVESQLGLVFSVQGQLMAWRRALALVPGQAMAADDLDLMLQARLLGRPIRRVAAARFFEVRPPRGRERDAQAVRRARAYHQFLRHPRIGELADSGSWFARAQVSAYRRAGRARGGWALVPLAAIFAAGWIWGPTPAIAAAGVCAALLLPIWWILLRVRMRMQIAAALEASSPMGGRWETARR